MMFSLQLMAFSIDIGLPLFIRRSDFNNETINSDFQLNSSTVFYGLNQFSRLNDCLLKYAESKGNRIKIKWHSKGKVLLIILCQEEYLLREKHLDRFLVLIINAIQMTCGPDVFFIEDFDKQKRDLKFAHHLLDCLVNLFVSTNVDRINVIAHSVNYEPIDRSKSINSFLSFLNRLESIQYWALFVQEKLTFASKEWWSTLVSDHHTYSCLICYLINSFTDTVLEKGMEKITIFLPYENNVIPQNLTIIPLAKHLRVCLISSKNSNLNYLTSEIPAINDSTEPSSILNSSSLLNGDNDKAISAFIIFNTKHRIHSIYNPTIVQNYLDEIIVFCNCDFNSENEQDSIIANDHLIMCKISNKHFILCTLFTSINQQQLSLQKLKKLTKNLAFNLLNLNKNKSIWP
ncbi:uncharacterized protein LOC124492468 [Dermatophagoides farinae]|uniref:uncharacterized protein LOC124492468 n=1 Tax=Dermatophagoides farinae TaxID=6954 RepID=UPI003F5E0DBB